MLAASNLKEIESIASDFIKQVWNDRTLIFSPEYYFESAKILRDALFRGWSGEKAIELSFKQSINIDYKSEDWLTIQMMEMNLFRFSAARSLGVAQELNQLLPKHNTFSSYKKAAESVILPYQTKYLNTEYNFAYATAQNAANYHKLAAMKDNFPSWQYKTIGDARVRAAHKELNNMIFKAEDPAFDAILPPNGWGCRCYIKPLRSVSEKYDTKQDAIKALNKHADKNGVTEWDKMVKGRFNVNRAKLKYIMDENKFYVQKQLLGKLSYKSFNLNDFNSIMKSGELKKVMEIERKREQALKWFDNKVKTDTDNILFYDYNKKPISLNRKNFIKHIKEHKEGDIPRIKIIDEIPEMLLKPDEVWMHFDNVYYLRYIKYYKGVALNVWCKLGDGKLPQIITWHDLKAQNIDINKRSGILIYKK